MVKAFLKSGCVIFFILVFIVLAHIIYFGSTYIDTTIISGEGYGFKIGQTKEEVFQKATDVYQNEKYQLTKDQNRWEIRFQTQCLSHRELFLSLKRFLSQGVRVLQGFPSQPSPSFPLVRFLTG